MKALGFYFQPKWASRPLVWIYRRGFSYVRRYSPTPSSRNRIAQLCRTRKPDVIHKNDGMKISHFVIIQKGTPS